MTFPIDLYIGFITIPSHMVVETLAFFIGYKYYLYRVKKEPGVKLSPYASWGIICGAAIGALIGSRLIAALENPEMFLNPPSWIYYLGSQTIAGGIIGGFIGVEVAKKILKIKRKTGDIFVYPLILAIMIGRVGCFLTGVKDGTTGLPSDLPWAFDQGDGIARHPTALYEIIFLGILWGFIRLFEKKKNRKQGDLFTFFMIGYLGFRFFIEFIKPMNPILFGLSSIQIASLIIVIYYLIYIIVRKKHDR